MPSPVLHDFVGSGKAVKRRTAAAAYKRPRSMQNTQVFQGLHRGTPTRGAWEDTRKHAMCARANPVCCLFRALFFCAAASLALPSANTTGVAATSCSTNGLSCTYTCAGGYAPSAGKAATAGGGAWSAARGSLDDDELNF